ncbi:MAG: hypothetical protein ACLUD2_18260 [Clostridium sp.]
MEIFVGAFKRQMDGKRRRLDLLLSHFHMDHLMGLYGSSFLFDPQMEVHIYGERPGEKSLKECLCQMFGPPYWPLPLDQLPALSGFMRFRREMCFCWRIRSGCKHLAANIRAEAFYTGWRRQRKGLGQPASCTGLTGELTDAMFQKLKEFAGACGLLICDACYTEAELLLRQGWGHGSIERCRKLRQASGAQQALFMHYERGLSGIRFCESRRKYHWRRIRPVCLRGRVWLSKYMGKDDCQQKDKNTVWRIA